MLFVRDRSAYVAFFVRTMRMAEDQRYFDRILTQARRRRIEEDRFGRP